MPNNGCGEVFFFTFVSFGPRGSPRAGSYWHEGAAAEQRKLKFNAAKEAPDISVGRYTHRPGRLAAMAGEGVFDSIGLA